MESGCLPADHLHKPGRGPATGAPSLEFLVLHRAHPEEESSAQTDKIKLLQTQMGIRFMIKTGRFDKLAVQKAQN